MTKKFSLLLASILLLVLVVGLIRSATVRPTRVPQAPAAIGTLDWYAQEAVTAGKESFNFRAARVEHTQPDTWDDVLENYTLVSATLLMSQSYSAAMNRDIETWYKFRINETISSRPLVNCDSCPAYPTAPPELLPLQSNEILVAKSGGSLFYNGINLTAQDPEFPDFVVSQNYLLILQIDTATQVGDLSLGPWGAYLVDTSANLHVINPNADVYHDDLASRYGTNLNQLKAVLNPQPPTTCNPVQEQNCYDIDGSWNPTTCHCTGGNTMCLHKPWLCD